MDGILSLSLSVNSIDHVLSSIEGNYDKVMYYQNPYVKVSNTIWSDDFETDKGWTISDGEWERGPPKGLGGESYGNPDPSDAYKDRKSVV